MIGLRGGNPCMVLAHQATVQLLCYIEIVEKRGEPPKHRVSGSSSMEKSNTYDGRVEQAAAAVRNRAGTRGREMNLVRIVGVLLIVAGVLGVVFNSFSFTKETHELKLGPIELSVKEKQSVDIPVWASVGAIVVGGVLLVFGNRKG
jgi:hypothetical protein